jgi:glycosyltransferase involved in cell wall biosynthesis
VSASRQDEPASGSRSVSVVIPTHNRRPFLERALSCVLLQQDVDVDVIVVDDGSSDDTPNLLTASAHPKVRWVRHEIPRGLPAARNAGLALAERPWVAFLDDDDLWGPRRLAAQLDALASSGAGWACSDAALVDHRFRVLGIHPAPFGVDVRGEILQRNIIPGGGSSVLARTQLVREVGGFDESLPSVEDWDLWIRLALVSPLISVPRADVGYFLHTGSMSRDIVRMEAGRDQVLARYAAERRAAGVEYDYPWWDGYVLGLQLASGRRREAARVKLGMLDRRRPLQGLVGLLAALVAPKAVERRQQRRQLADYSPDRAAEADQWLAALGGRAVEDQRHPAEAPAAG